ncbi:MAG TPA: energy-coupling factor transporter transmembrane component T [Nocardioidaceae bacterium]|nr:energy-coupling factor transporter transmembrane component T [Nocardioidaceae bacterium]
MRPANRPRFPRTLHPGAWWLWAIGLAAGATRTTNPVILLLLVAVAGFVVVTRRSRAPWGRAYGAFLRLGLVIIAIRIVLQALLSSESQGVHVIVDLPQLPLPAWLAGLKLGGLVTWEAVLTAFAAGLQLAAIICCVGTANALASAQRLLRCVPAALYEAGVAVVVAMTFAPQLVADAARVRAASRLRGYDRAGFAVLRHTARPVLEGALNRSVTLAAAMDARGYGRTAVSSRRVRAASSTLVLGGLLGVCIGVYGLLDADAGGWLGLPLLGAGAGLAIGGLVAGGRRTGRTSYRPDLWALPEWLVAASGLGCAAALVVLARVDPAASAPPYPVQLPQVPLLALLGPLLGLLPAVVAPPPADRVAPAPLATPRFRDGRYAASSIAAREGSSIAGVTEGGHGQCADPAVPGRRRLGRRTGVPERR